MVKDKKLEKAKAVIGYIQKYPISAAWIIQELLEGICDGNCEKCYFKLYCCNLSELERLNSGLNSESN